MADALYSGHLNVGDTFFKKGCQVLLIKPVYGGQFSEHLDMTDTIFRPEEQLVYAIAILNFNNKMLLKEYEKK